MTMIFTGNVIALETETVILPNGHQMQVEIVRHPGGAAVVALDDKQNLCLLRHYRCIFNDWFWELPAGKIDNGENPANTASRELAEETGADAQVWNALGYMISSPGVFTEKVYFYLARKLSLGKPNRDADELMELHWVPLTQALMWCDSGKIVDAKTIIAIDRANKFLHQS